MTKTNNFPCSICPSELHGDDFHVTAPAQGWAEKAHRLVPCRGVGAFAQPVGCSQDVNGGPWNLCPLHEAVALALSDAARTGREDGLEEAAQYYDDIDSLDVPFWPNQIAQQIRALRGKEPK